MSEIKETVKLIFCEAETNNNKVWTGILYDNNDVETKWGRVGKSLQSKRFHGVGSRYLHTKAAEKRKKGYTELKTVEEVGASSGKVTVPQGTLATVAKRDIVCSSPLVSALVDRLVKSNIHNIVTSTTITYNTVTGLFTTPLGVVTQEAIDDARVILASIKKDFKDEKKLKQHVSKYLRLIPHDIGMKFRVETIFPDDDQSIQKELGVLDSLQASYDAMQAAPATSATPDAPRESVFDLTIDIVQPGDPVYLELEKFYRKSNKPMHGYQNKKIVNAYKVNCGPVTKGFDPKIGNLVQVFHGTSEANLLSILKTGMKVSPPSSAYIAGKMFGNGVYGSETASKSLGYTFGRWGGSSSTSGWLFICDFAMGNAWYANRTGNPPAGFDSTWAKPGNVGLANDELIVYKEKQILIKYLLEIR